MPLRAAVLGALKTPPLGLSLALLGRDRTLQRLGQQLQAPEVAARPR